MTMTYIAVPIAAKNLEQAQQQIDSAVKAGAEMLELRTDYLEGLNTELAAKLKGIAKEACGSKKIPIIATCRDKRQGGAIDYPEKLRIEVLAEAVNAGADFVDFEYENYLYPANQEKLRLALSKNGKARLILSTHNFETKPANIGKLFRTITNTCLGVIPKIVYKANHINDCFEAFDLLHQTSGERIVFCMGQAGMVSRIIAKKLGSFVTFASIDPQNQTAPGQLTIEQLKNLYRFDDIDAGTELFGIIADPVAHSLSPAIHNACFAAENMNRLYLPLLVQGQQQEFDSFLKNIILRKWLHIRGLSITIPHKQNALNFVRQNTGYIEPLAEKIGAVNTIVIHQGGRLKAYNTDYGAALDAITDGMKITRAELKQMPVAVIGAGGVARAIIAGLSDAGAKIRIYNRTFEKARALAEQFNCEFSRLDDLRAVDAKLLINCTSVGMYPDTQATNIPQESITSSMAVFETIYNPAETMLLKEAKGMNALCIDGITMFVNQAMAQFKLFTGVDCSAQLMRKVAIDLLTEGSNKSSDLTEL
jgi:3-dehydroquinate dehydratase / shikimate dehydrogenase